MDAGASAACSNADIIDETPAPVASSRPYRRWAGGVRSRVSESDPLGAGHLNDRTILWQLVDGHTAPCGPPSWIARQGRAQSLAPDPLLAALPRLRDEGYEVIHLSEPLRYPRLAAFLAMAKAQGFRITAESDGQFILPRHRAEIEALDQVAISFDGAEASHNAMRGNSRARGRAVAALRYLAEIGTPSAAILTMTRKTLAEVPEFIELCAALDVRLVQLRPLVRAGGAVEAASGLALTDADCAQLWQTAQGLAQDWDGALTVQVDLTPAAGLATDAAAWGMTEQRSLDHRLSDAVNPLAITPEGRLRPWMHDFPEEFDLGHLQDLDPARRIWISLGLPRLRRLLARSLQAAALEDGVLDWSGFRRDLVRPPVKPSA